VSFEHTSAERVFSNTPFETWYTQQEWTLMEPPVKHALLALALLKKYGGGFLEAGLLSIRPLGDIYVDSISSLRTVSLPSAMFFRPAHNVVEQICRVLASELQYNHVLDVPATIKASMQHLQQTGRISILPRRYFDITQGSKGYFYSTLSRGGPWRYPDTRAVFLDETVVRDESSTATQLFEMCELLTNPKLEPVKFVVIAESATNAEAFAAALELIQGVHCKCVIAVRFLSHHPLMWQVQEAYTCFPLFPSARGNTTHVPAGVSAISYLYIGWASLVALLRRRILQIPFVSYIRVLNQGHQAH
jgi:hypothetical protein